jgi:flagellar hook-associated protein 2
MVGITGIGSGINIDSIVTALVNAERGPKDAQLNRLEKATTSRLSAMGTFRSVLNEFSIAVQSLNKLTAFQKQSISSSSPSVLTASSTGDVSPGTFSLQVQQLAASSKVALQSVSGGTATTFNTGEITVSAGSSNFSIVVTSENNSLAGIRDAINAEGETSGVSASIVTDGSGSRLILSSNKTGAGNDVQVSVANEAASTGENSLQALAYSSAESSIQLAKVADGSVATFKAGSLFITSGSETLEVVVNDGDQLGDILGSINALGVGQGFSASLEAVEGGAARLVVRSASGDAVNVTAGGVDTGSGSNNLSVLASTAQANAKTIDQAKSAIFSVDGLSVVKDSNSISGVIDGVTINLVSAQSAEDIAAGKTVDVTVGKDRSLARSNLQKFVDAYNKLIQTTSELTAVVQVGVGKPPVTGPLLGDSSIRNILASMRNEMTQLGGADGIGSLAELGITTGRDGKLSLNGEKLDAALAGGNYEKVAEFLAGDNGLMGRVNNIVSPYTVTGGILAQRQQGLQATVSNIDKQRDALSLRIEKVQARLYSQFNAMDSLVGQLKKTSESLTNQLASLPGFVNKSKR